MFDIQDEKLGKVKVVNVTEARASMASIMNNHDVSYIITKNNKPIRLILNFDLYQRSVKDSLQKYSEGLSDSESSFNSEVVRGTSKDPVRGLLETRLKDLYHDLSKSDPKTVKANIEKNIENALPTFSHPALTETGHQDQKTNDDLLAEPLELESEEEFLNRLQATDDAPLYSPSSSSSAVESPSIENSNNDYFTKYRKLYESVPLRPPLLNFSQSSASSESGARVENSVRAEPAAPAVTASALTTHNNLLGSSENLKNQKRELPSIRDLIKDFDDEKTPRTTQGPDKKYWWSPS